MRKREHNFMLRVIQDKYFYMRFELINLTNYERHDTPPMNKNYEELLYFSRLRLGHIGSMVGFCY